MTLRPVALLAVPTVPTSSKDKPISGTRARRFSYAGTVPQSSIYLEREADRILPEALAAGEFCHVFGPRQIGKSSLRSRVTKKLTAQGIRCAAIDMMGLGTSSTEEQWFYALVEEIANKLQLDDSHEFWQRHPHVSPARRWGLYLRHIVQEEIVDRRCVLMLDEIESVMTAAFPTDDFFLILRELFEARSDEPSLERLAICLMGVTVPDDLLKEKRSTPYNISRRVRLDDFTRSELAGLAVGLDDLGVSAAALLDAVYAWTDGHPYMTMRTCEAIHQRGAVEQGQEQAMVDAVVQDLFLTHAMDDANLRYAADRFTDAAFDKPDLPLMEKVLLLRRLLDGERVPADLESPVQMELHLCGMLKGFSDADGQWVRTRNRIFASVFDVHWLQSRGDRRYLGGALWKWHESGKKKDYLLRGQALLEALAKDARLWTAEEREFLVEGLKEEIEGLQRQLVLARTLEFAIKTLQVFPNRVQSILNYDVAIESYSKSIAHYLIFIGVASFGAAGVSVAHVMSALTAFYAIVGLLFLVCGGITRYLLRNWHKGWKNLQNTVSSAQEDISKIDVSVPIAQLLQEGEAKVASLREHLARLTSTR